jgi:hypothetical protein
MTQSGHGLLRIFAARAESHSTQRTGPDALEGADFPKRTDLATAFQHSRRNLAQIGFKGFPRRFFNITVAGFP